MDQVYFCKTYYEITISQVVYSEKKIHWNFRGLD